MCTALDKIVRFYANKFEDVDSITIHTIQSGRQRHAYDTIWLSALAAIESIVVRALVRKTIDGSL